MIVEYWVNVRVTLSLGVVRRQIGLGCVWQLLAICAAAFLHCAVQRKWGYNAPEMVAPQKTLPDKNQFNPSYQPSWVINDHWSSVWFCI